jgi:hypothetical protein
VELGFHVLVMDRDTKAACRKVRDVETRVALSEMLGLRVARTGMPVPRVTQTWTPGQCMAWAGMSGPRVAWAWAPVLFVARR